MIIEQLPNDEIKITPQNDLDMRFWANIKAQLKTQEVEIESLHRQLTIAKHELSFYKKECNDKNT